MNVADRCTVDWRSKPHTLAETTCFAVVGISGNFEAPKPVMGKRTPLTLRCRITSHTHTQSNHLFAGIKGSITG